MLNLTSAKQAWRLVFAQFSVALIASLLLIFPGWIYAWSGLIGGLIATAANALFALRVFVRYRAQAPGMLLRRFYGAELQKLILTAILFAATIIWVKSLSAAALFGVYLLVQMTPVFVAHRLD